MSTPRQIELDDIRKGDYIEVVWERNDRTDTWRGIAVRKDDNGWWRTLGGQLLVGPVLVEDRTITLLHRPAPAEPEGLGAVVRTAEGIEYVSVNRKPGTPRWVDAGVHDTSGRRALKWAELTRCTTAIEVLSEGNEEGESDE